MNKKVLFIIPHDNFRDKELTWVAERLDEAMIGYEVASTHISDAIGQFGHVVTPDVLIKHVSPADYNGYIFVGEEVASKYVGDPEITRLLEGAFSLKKVVAAIGHAVTIIAGSSHITNKKVTCIPNDLAKIESAGAYYTGRIIEQDGDLITANGPHATREFAEAIVKALNWADDNSLEGRRYLR